MITFAIAASPQEKAVDENGSQKGRLELSSSQCLTDHLHTETTEENGLFLSTDCQLCLSLLRNLLAEKGWLKLLRRVPAV